MKNLNVKKVSIDILMDIIGGILIAIGTYNFAAASEFPMVGFNGIGLILYHLFGMPIGTVAFVLNIPVAIACFKILGRDFFYQIDTDHCNYFRNYGPGCAKISSL